MKKIKIKVLLAIKDDRPTGTTITGTTNRVVPIKKYILRGIHFRHRFLTLNYRQRKPLETESKKVQTAGGPVGSLYK